MHDLLMPVHYAARTIIWDKQKRNVYKSNYPGEKTDDSNPFLALLLVSVVIF